MSDKPLSPRRITVSVLLLWVAGLGAAMQFAKIGVPFAALGAHYPDAGPMLGFLLSSVSVMGVVFGLFAGGLVARFGLERMILGALALGAALSLWQASLPGMWPLMASRVVEGASHLILVIAAPTLIAQITPDRARGMAMTLWATFFGVAFALTAWLGQPLVDAYGVAALFVAHGGLMAGVALALWLVLPSAPKGQGAATATGLFSLSEIVKSHRRAYASPRISAAGLGWLFYSPSFVSLLSILPDLVPSDQRVYVASMMPLASIATSLLLVPLLMRLMSAAQVVILGFGLSALTLPLLSSGVARAEVIILLFAVLGLVQGASFAAVPQLNSGLEDRAEANALMAQTGNLGSLIGPPAVLAILASGGLSALIFAVAACYLMGIAAHIWTALRRSRG